jgi:hypothetical protein
LSRSDESIEPMDSAYMRQNVGSLDPMPSLLSPSDSERRPLTARNPLTRAFRAICRQKWPTGVVQYPREIEDEVGENAPRDRATAPARAGFVAGTALLTTSAEETGDPIERQDRRPPRS